MAGPLTGVGTQQLPISNTFQPGGNQTDTQVRENEDSEPQENTVQAQGTAPSETQNTATEDQDTGIELRTEGQASSASASEGETPERGSLVDIEA